jgi:hypothetical protein
MAALTFAKENLNVAAQYGTWITPGEVQGPEEIQCGSRAIIRRGLSKIAVYRDPSGKRMNIPQFVHTSAVSWLGTKRKVVGIPLPRLAI